MFTIVRQVSLKSTNRQFWSWSDHLTSCSIDPPISTCHIYWRRSRPEPSLHHRARSHLGL